MFFAADQIHGHTAACIEMRRIWLTVRIDGHQHSLARRLTLEDTLFVGQHNGTEVPIIERFGFLLRFA